MDDYADELCITPNYLNAVVKKQTGFPASHHIQQLVIMEAKRYAMYSALTMKEVADRLGFDDCAHFSKFFKNFSGTNFFDVQAGLCLKIPIWLQSPSFKLQPGVRHPPIFVW